MTQTALAGPELELALSRLAAAAKRLARRTLARVGRALSRGTHAQAHAAAARALSDHADALAGLLSEADLAGSLLGAQAVAARLPEAPPPYQQPAPPPGRLEALRSTLERLPAAYREPFLAALPADEARALAGSAGVPEVPTRQLIGAPEPDGVRLPLVERASEALAEKKLVTYERQRQLARAGRAEALAVAARGEQEALGKLHEVLVEQVREGGTLADFRRRVMDELPEGTFASEAGLETTFRDALQTAYGEGMDRLLSDPIVGGLFPYESTEPIRDSRLSSMCALAARCGIAGTNVFRRDDPTWQRVKPPRHPRCRCGRVAMTVEDAAEAGVAEARRWLRDGRPPAVPSWVPMPRELAEAGL